MTYAEEPEVTRTAVGTKVLMFGFAILAVLGSFWSIIWFIRSYVEPPRVMLPAPMALAAQESTPVVPPAPTTPPVSSPSTDNAAPDTVPTASTPAAPPVPPPASEPPAASGAVADRWFPVNQLAAPAQNSAAASTPAPAAPLPETDPAPTPPADATPTTSVATALATPPENDAVEEVVEGSVPAIPGPAPLPRRRPTMTASAAKRNADPPLPRPRPDGPAPQSIWTAVPTTDDRYPGQ